MKKYIIVFALLSSLLVGCIKNNPVIVENKVAEFDATALNTNGPGLTFPIMTRIPAYGRVVGTADSTIRRYAQVIRLRINLVGPQSTKDETVGFEITTVPPSISAITFPSTITGQTPASALASLSVTNATVTDFSVPAIGNVTIPANSSFGFLNLTILSTPSTGVAKYVGLKLNANGSIKQSVNYSELGLVIDQR